MPANIDASTAIFKASFVEKIIFDRLGKGSRDWLLLASGAVMLRSQKSFLNARSTNYRA
jgi:hypothetical protein